MRVLSGLQPSGKLHLGNYFGALRQCLAVPEQAEALFFVADLHALTSLRDGTALREHSLAAALDYLALGLDPKRCIIFLQSDVSLHAELAWILATVTPLALLERAHSYKDKLARGQSAEAGLFTYPILMAADILLYGATHVPVGPDQRQHLEITRDICTKFNVAYVAGFDPQDPHGERRGSPGILRMPEAQLVGDGVQVPGTDGQKMSKSYGNTLELFGDERRLRRAIMSIQTDSTPIESPKPPDSALWQLLCLFVDDAERQALGDSWRRGGVGYGTYKKRLAELYLDHFASARARRAELAQQKGFVEDVLQDGAQRARRAAEPIWQAVLQATGLRAARRK